MRLTSRLKSLLKVQIRKWALECKKMGWSEMETPIILIEKSSLNWLMIFVHLPPHMYRNLIGFDLNYCWLSFLLKARFHQKLLKRVWHSPLPLKLYRARLLSSNKKCTFLISPLDINVPIDFQLQLYEFAVLPQPKLLVSSAISTSH